MGGWIGSREERGPISDGSRDKCRESERMAKTPRDAKREGARGQRQSEHNKLIAESSWGNLIKKGFSCAVFKIGFARISRMFDGF